MCRSLLEMFSLQGRELAQGLPVELTAAEFLVATVAANPGQVTILALAALTNVALALQLDPSMAQNMVRFISHTSAHICISQHILCYRSQHNLHLCMYFRSQDIIWHTLNMLV